VTGWAGARAYAPATARRPMPYPSSLLTRLVLRMLGAPAPLRLGRQFWGSDRGSQVCKSSRWTCLTRRRWPCAASQSAAVSADAAADDLAPASIGCWLRVPQTAALAALWLQPRCDRQQYPNRCTSTLTPAVTGQLRGSTNIVVSGNSGASRDLDASRRDRGKTCWLLRRS
jgi:hypothetical protein